MASEVLICLSSVTLPPAHVPAPAYMIKGMIEKIFTQAFFLTEKLAVLSSEDE